MKNKILSLLCVLSIATSMIVGMTVANAASGDPSFVVKVETGEKYVAALPDSVTQYAVIVSVADVPDLVPYSEEFNWETYETDITLTAMSALECHLKYDTNTFAYNSIQTPLTGTVTSGANGMLDFTWSTTDKSAMLSENGEIAKFILIKKPTGDNTSVEFNADKSATIRRIQYTPTDKLGTVTDYSTITSNLNLVIDTGAPKLADFTALNAAIAAYEAKNEADYTAESWAVAKAAYDTAKAIDQAAETDQDKVNAAATALSNAIAALELKPVDKVTVTPDARREKKDNASGLWTYGFSGTVTKTGSASYSKLVFNFADGAKVGTYTWDLGAALDASITYGLNIWGCPVGSDVTATVTAE